MSIQPFAIGDAQIRNWRVNYTRCHYRESASLGRPHLGTSSVGLYGELVLKLEASIMPWAELIQPLLAIFEGILSSPVNGAVVNFPPSSIFLAEPWFTYCWRLCIAGAVLVLIERY